MQKGKHPKRYPAGSMELANWQQFKALLRTDNRITESLEPMREHAELVESERQARFAAELWKAHAESAVPLTEREKAIIRELVDNHFHMVGDNTCASFMVGDKDVTIREWVNLRSKVA